MTLFPLLPNFQFSRQKIDIFEDISFFFFNKIFINYMWLKYIINTITDVLISIKPQFRSSFFIFHK